MSKSVYRGLNPESGLLSIQGFLLNKLTSLSARFSVKQYRILKRAVSPGSMLITIMEKFLAWNRRQLKYTGMLYCLLTPTHDLRANVHKDLAGP